MKIPKGFLRFTWILMIILIGSCGRSDHVVTTVQVLHTPVNASPKSTMPQIVPSETATTISVISPTPLVASTPVPHSTATVRLVPSLTADEARKRLNDLLTTNGGCQLPCLWGITPDKTSNQEAITLLASLSGLSEFHVFKPDSGSITAYDRLKDGRILSTYISYLTNNDKVNSILFISRAIEELSGEDGFRDIFDSTDFGERLNNYMLHQVLNSLGRPSSVRMTTLGEFPPARYGQGHFKIILLYPEQGFAVQYTTEMQVVGKNVEGCLANAHVEMEFFPAGNTDAFYEQLALTDWKRRIEYYKPIEEVTTMSVDDFYQTFRQHPTICLETPANLWPLPER